MEKNAADAVIVVDMQADFTELRNGALAVPGTGQSYVDRVVSRTREYKEAGLPVVATRDWHPADHVSFITSHPGARVLDVVKVGDVEQILWPPHCVQGSPGAEILLPGDLIDEVVSTGHRREFDSYSAFRDDGGADTELKAVLDGLGAKRLIVYGLATDYCVRATVLHALEEGYDVTLDLELSRGITLADEQAAVDEMKRAGADVTDRPEVESPGGYRCIPLGGPSRKKVSE